MVAPSHSRLTGVFNGYFQYARRIEREDLGGWILSRDSDSVQAVAGRYVQNLNGPGGIHFERGSRKFGYRPGDRRHGAGVFQPIQIRGTRSALDSLPEAAERGYGGITGQELHGGSQICGR